MIQWTYLAYIHVYHTSTECAYMFIFEYYVYLIEYYALIGQYLVFYLIHDYSDEQYSDIYQICIYGWYTYVYILSISTLMNAI